MGFDWQLWVYGLDDIFVVSYLLVDVKNCWVFDVIYYCVLYDEIKVEICDFSYYEEVV